MRARLRDVEGLIVICRVKIDQVGELIAEGDQGQGEFAGDPAFIPESGFDAFIGFGA